MMRFIKQRWVLIAVVAGATALFIIYGLPKINKMSQKAGTKTNAPSTTAEEPKQTLQSRLIGNVTLSGN